MSDGSLDGKVAVVTGGGRGIGAAIAARLSSDGAAVIVNFAHSQSRANAVAEAIRSRGGRAVAVEGDVSRPSHADDLMESAIVQFGRLDLLVNNAGVADFAALEQIDEAHVERHFAINVRGVLWASKAAARRFDGVGGRIINLSSVAADHGPPGRAVYAASKATVEAITKVLAAELGPRGVAVNAIAPGPVETELYARDNEAMFLARTPFGRIGQPEDIAAVVALLASPEAAWITGQVIAASGGFRF